MFYGTIAVLASVSRDVMLTSCCGSVFHVLMTLEKKEYCMAFFLVCGCRYRMLRPLVVEPVGMRYGAG